MSKRTSDANKAVMAAWLNEQQLVREGKGTRDWTPEQQQNILDKGKAYDDNGKAFEGHHMKSAEMFPEYQGDSGNTQFLSRSEHFAAHNGNFQNPTNGYFNPSTGKTKDFGLNKYELCAIIELNDPVIHINNQAESSEKNIGRFADADNMVKDDVLPDSAKPDNNTSVKSKAANSNTSKHQSVEQGLASKGIGRVKQFVSKNIKSAFNTVVEFVVENPEKAIMTGGLVVKAIRTVIKSRDGDHRLSFNEENDVSSVLKESSFDKDSFDEVDISDDPLSGGKENLNRTSPCEHSVSGYDRQQNGKTVHVSPYTRGGNKK